MKIKNVERAVETALGKYPPCRDDDMLLFGYVILNNFGEGELKAISGWQLLGHIMHSRTPHFTSVLRCRQKLQQLYPRLRGKKYDQRHRRSTTIKEELKHWINEDQQNLLK